MTLSEHFHTCGYAITPPLLLPVTCAALHRKTARLTQSVGTRGLLRYPWCTALAQRLLRHPGLAPLLPVTAMAVQCTFFEKSAEKNWLVPWHQDLSLPMATGLAHPAFKGWSEKEGQLFAQPPAELLEQISVVRLQLDDAAADNGALRVVPRSHRHGRLDDAAIQTLRQRYHEKLCVVPAGAAMVMRPLLLHASSKAISRRPRRVLHFLFAPADLLKPFGRSWT